MPGPIPTRSDQRRRRNVRDDQIHRAAGAAAVPVPPADESWHPIAVEWYESLAKSGQSALYEPSDWSTARYVAEAMSRNLAASRFSAQLFAAVMAASTSLLVTEGDRRRLRIELERSQEVAEEAPDVSWIDDARARLRASD